MDKNLSSPSLLTEDDKPMHPIVILFLILPFGIIQGYLTVTLAFLYSKAGVSVEEVAGLIGVSLIPSILRFLWAPLVDITLTVKKWYLIGNVISAAGILAIGILPAKESSVPLLMVIVLFSYFAVTFVSLSVSNIMAYDTRPEIQGRAGGYYNAGGLGGIGIGGGFGLWLAVRLPSVWMVGGVLAIACLLCCLAILYVKEPASTIKVKRVSETIGNLFKDIWLTLKAKAGYLALFLALMPLGTGSAGSLFAALAKDWNASADTVALITGVLGGIITSIGCLLGGWICDKINRQLAYLLFGAFQGICAVGMAFCPHTQVLYIIWTLAYSIANGFAYAGFSAFVLEAMGKGAAATKYNIYSGLSNIPIYIVTIIDGWADTHWGANGMLNTEALCALAAIILFLAFKAVANIRRTSPAISGA